MRHTSLPDVKPGQYRSSAASGGDRARAASALDWVAPSPSSWLGSDSQKENNTLPTRRWSMVGGRGAPLGRDAASTRAAVKEGRDLVRDARGVGTSTRRSAKVSADLVAFFVFPLLIGHRDGCIFVV
ncbi:hypothetical protein MKEN_01326800 [Mycena kentingensis (nom. inval.)]|nr:hypothetical protein MKEN_01326800 [Mycena kentingensis (nom. inval.)]